MNELSVESEFLINFRYSKYTKRYLVLNITVEISYVPA